MNNEGAATAAVGTNASIALSHVYIPCADLAAMHSFYSGVLGLSGKGAENGFKHGFLIYRFGNAQIVFSQAQDPAAYSAPQGWARMPGWDGGDSDLPCWSLGLPESEFKTAVSRLQQSGATLRPSEPEWRNDEFWAICAKDPSGYTVELFCM